MLKRLYFGVLLTILLCAESFAQTPQVSPVSDESGFPGDSLCSTLSLTNAGPTGYGPYLQVIIPADVSLDGATLFGGAVTVTTVGVFPLAPGNQLTDPITGDTITGNEGDVLYILQPPIGSVVTGGIPLDIEICYTIDPNAPVNIPVPVTVTPVYEFGDTATGDNGPITGGTINFNVTPILVLFEKTNSAPEGERPPGDDWPVTYTLVAQVAPNNTIDSLDINDILPAGFIIDVPSINVTGGVGCTVNSNSPLNVTCTSVTATGGNDIVITYSGYFDDILDEGFCDAQTLTNVATFDGQFTGMPLSQESDSTDVNVEHFSVQKTANTTTGSPGDTVTFTLSMQLSEFATANALSIQDTLDDGYTFVPGSEASSLGAVTAGVVVNSGVTTLTFDLHAIAGDIAGGNPVITLSYDATIDQGFDNSAPILASDSLNNQVIATYGLTAGAAGCNDTSSHTVDILPVMIDKSIVNVQPFYEPGDTVTYRLTMQIPSGDTNGVVFTDYLPLPVFDATSVSTVFGTDIVFSPLNTLVIAPTGISTDVGTNSVIINWPNISTTTSQTLSVDLSVTITTDPFADNLSLSNLLAVDSQNSDTTTATNVTPISINVRSPEIAITKGVLSAVQGTINPPPATLPVDGDLIDADANDTVSFMITVENIGGARAFDVVITDPAVAGLNACAVTSVTDGTGTPLATTGAIATGLMLTDPLSANDDSPVDGGAPYGTDTALITYNCTIAANSEMNSELTNTASVSFAAATGATSFPTQSDDATVTIASPTLDKTILGVTPNVDGVNNTITVGEVITYQVEITLPEGVASGSEIVDRLDNGLLMVAVDSITGSAGVSTSVGGGFAAIAAAATGIGTRDLGLNFGNLTSNSSAETITIVYRVIVDDAPVIVDNLNRNNRVDFSSQEITRIRDNAPNRRVREPNLTINKAATPISGDAGDTIDYTITINNTGLSPAFDVVILDLINDSNLTLVNGTVTTSLGIVTTGNGGADTTIQVDIPSIAIGGNVIIGFDATIGNAVTSGTSIDNTASITNYNTIPGGGRVYPQVNGSTSVVVNTAQATKTVLGATSSESSGGISPQGDGSLVDLTIGESVTFEIVASIAEGVSPEVIITDTLPDSAAGQMQFVSAAVISEGANLTVTNSFPAPVIGPANVIQFDFGQVTNAPDGISDINDQIIVQIVAQVTDIASNQGIETLDNIVLVQYNSGLDTSSSATIEVVEPVMSIDKTSTTLTGDAGDVVTFVISVDNILANNSSANAFDVSLTDLLPTGFLFAGNLSTDSGLVPDTLTEAGGAVSATWASYPLGSSTVISFDATIDNGVNPEQVIQNTAAVTWDSMPGSVAEQRLGSTTDGHSITIGMAGLAKSVITTSEAYTGTGVNGSEDDLTIGETVTYQFTVSLPEGTTPGASATDQLPTTGTVMDVVSSQILSVGGQITLGMGGVGAPGSEIDTNADTFNDQVSWILGDVLNTPDGMTDNNDEIVFEVVAVIVDSPINQAGANDVINQARLDYTGGVLQSTALIDVVEPLLNITKESIPSVVIGDAGDTLNFRLTIEHDSSSSADAQSIQITDNLPVPGSEWINDATVVTTCPGLVTNSSGEPAIVFTMPDLSLTTNSCTIDYQVTVSNLVNPNSNYQNVANLQYDSTPVFVAGQTRRYSDSDDASFDTTVPSLIKTVVNSSMNETGSSVGDPLLEDLVIGELVDFNLTVTFPEGTIDNAVIQDNLPLIGSGGILEAVSASVVSSGTQIITSLPGTGVISNTDGDAFNDQVIFDFGTVTNIPDGMTNINDQITVLITARVVNDPSNTDGDVLTNTAGFDFTGSAGPIISSASVEIVEPNLSFTKQMGPLVNGVVPITLTLDNIGGNSPVFDILITDVLDGNIWDLATISAVSIPSGFLMNVNAGAGISTVEISSDAAGSSPDNSLEPNEQLSFVFSASLRTDVILPNPIMNTAVVEEVNSTPGDNTQERDYSDLIGNDQLGFSDVSSTKDDSILIDNNFDGFANPGDTIRYDINITNNGTTAATIVTFDDIPDINTSLVVGSVTTSQGTVLIGNTAGDSTVSIDVGSIAVAATITITFDVVINDPFPVGVEQISNQGTVSSDEFPPVDTDDPDTIPGSDPTITPVIAEHDLAVTKDDGGVIAIAGQTIPYSITYDNLGDQNATGVVITETVPDNTIFNPGATPDLWVCVPDNAAGSSCTLSIGNLDGGASGTALFTVDVFNPKPAGVVQIDNTISISDDGLNGPEVDTSNNVDNEVTPVEAAPDLTLDKSDSVAIVAPGSTVLFTLTYSNVGTQDATGVVITETVPNNTTFSATGSSAGWSCADGAPSGTVCMFTVGNLAATDPAQSVTFEVTVDDPLPVGVDEVQNSASIADDGSNGADTNPGNNIDTENTPIGALPDLFINKTDNDATSGPGGMVTYQLDYGNIGTQDASGVVVTETVPANSQFDAINSTVGWVCLPDNTAGSTCEFPVGNLNVGDTGTVNFAVIIDDPLPAGVNELFNTVSIGDDGTNGVDPDPSNNVAVDNTGLSLEPPVGIKTGEFDANDPKLIHWTFYWFNPNNNRDLPVFIFDEIPDNTIFAGGESCIASGASTCTVPTYNAGLNRIELTGIIAPDFGAPNNSAVDDLTNEIVITFDTRVTENGTVRIVNQAFANWDQDNDGDPNNDANNGQPPIPTDSPLTPSFGDPTILGGSFAVPTLSQYALMLLIFTVLMATYFHQRRKEAVTA